MIESLLSWEQRDLGKRQLEERWRAILTPPQDIPVAEWGEQNVIIPPGMSSIPGPFRHERAPYLSEILECLKDPEVSTITLLFAAQNGKTLALIVAILWTMSQDPAPVIFVIATRDMARDVSIQRFDKIIESSPEVEALCRKAHKSDWTTFTKSFKTGVCYFAGGQSAISAVSRPARILILDEIDKYKGATKKEAPVFYQFRERVNAWPNSKIFQSEPRRSNRADLHAIFGRGSVIFLAPLSALWHKTEAHLLRIDRVDGKKKSIGSSGIRGPKTPRPESGTSSERPKRAYIECINPECVQTAPHFGGSMTNTKPRCCSGGSGFQHSPSGRNIEVFIYRRCIPIGGLSARSSESFWNEEKRLNGIHQFRQDTLCEPWEPRTRAATQHALMKKCGD